MSPQIQWTAGGVVGALIGLGLTWLLIQAGVVTSPFDFGDAWMRAWIAGGFIITACSFAGWGLEMAVTNKNDN